MKRPARIVAVEEHFVSTAVLDATGGRARLARMQPTLLDDLTSLGERRLAAMDAAGIDLQVISHASATSTAGLGRDQAAALLRQANDELAQATAAHPDRFAGLATLPMSDPELAADELERGVRELGLVGGIVNGTTEGRFLDHSSFGPLLDRFATLDVPLYLHPGPPPARVADVYYADLPGAVGQVLGTSAWGWHAETALHVVRMAAAGVFDRHPGLRIVVGHMGEMLPFMLARVDGTLRPAITGRNRPLSEIVRSHVHITTSALFTLPPLLCALQTFGIDRMMFAVDWPFSRNEPGARLLELGVLAPDDAERLAHGNAERVFGLRAGRQAGAVRTDPDRRALTRTSARR